MHSAEIQRHLEDDEANGIHISTDLHYNIQLEKYSRLDGCGRFASASSAFRQAGSGGKVVWAGKQPRERRPPT
jgi:hypothetical protein